MHIYAFGSVCRGEISHDSDIDLLAIVDGYDSRFDPHEYSIYSYGRIRELWREGNPFAWHLSIEAKLLFASDGKNTLDSLGPPAPYSSCTRDCEKFFALFLDARKSLEASEASSVFDLSVAFLSIRNIATCFSLGVSGRPEFSRHSALRLPGCSLDIPGTAYKILERSRILCTRGYGARITSEETRIATSQFANIADWMAILVREAGRHAA